MNEWGQRPYVYIATLGNAAPVITLALDRLLKKHTFAEVCVIHTNAEPDPERAAKGMATMHETIKQLDREFVNKVSLIQTEEEKKWKVDYRVGNEWHQFNYRRILLRREETVPGQLEPKYEPINDVETEANANATFRTIYRILKRYKEQRAIIHLNIAGGRKSMSVFGMSSAQLLFWPEDRVWHVVSQEEFMTKQVMHDDSGQSLLVPIPVIRLSSASPVLGMLLTSSDPYDALAAQENFLYLSDRHRKEAFLKELDQDEREILVGIVQGLGNEEIGKRLSKPLGKSRVADKLTTIYETYMVSIAETPEDVTRPNSINMRTFLAAEFGTYFQQIGERL